MANDAAQLAKCMNTAIAMTTMMALTELVSSARDAMCTVGDDFGAADYKARCAQDGGT